MPVSQGPSLLSGQAPVTVSGPLRAPRVGVEAAPAANAVIASVREAVPADERCDARVVGVAEVGGGLPAEAPRRNARTLAPPFRRCRVNAAPRWRRAAWRWSYTVSTILPMWAPDSMRACAAAA